MTPTYTRDLLEVLTNAQLQTACKAKGLDYPTISDDSREAAIDALMAAVGYL